GPPPYSGPFPGEAGNTPRRKSEYCETDCCCVRSSSHTSRNGVVVSISVTFRRKRPPGFPQRESRWSRQIRICRFRSEGGVRNRVEKSSHLQRSELGVRRPPTARLDHIRASCLRNDRRRLGYRHRSICTRACDVAGIQRSAIVWSHGWRDVDTDGKRASGGSNQSARTGHIRFACASPRL